MSKLCKGGRLERQIEATRSLYAEVNETEEILQIVKILHEEQSKDGKADNAEDQEESAIKGRGRAKRKAKTKFLTGINSGKLCPYMVMELLVPCSCMWGQ